MPLAALTAHQALEALGLRGGETLFVGGGAGGVGHLAIQLAIARGARVVATASERNHDFLRELGAEPLDYARRRPRRARVRDARRRTRAPTPRSTCSAATPREQAFASLRRGGRLVSIARRPRSRRDGHHEVHYIFVRPSGYDLGEHVTPLVDEGSLRPHVQETFPLERAADAHELLEDGHVRGKLVLTVD